MILRAAIDFAGRELQQLEVVAASFGRGRAEIDDQSWPGHSGRNDSAAMTTGLSFRTMQLLSSGLRVAGIASSTRPAKGRR